MVLVATRPPAAASFRPFPVQVLLDRLGSGTQELPWSAYLPSRLQPLRMGHPGAGSGTGAPLDFEDVEITGRVWSLSQEAQGCRWVQRAIEVAEGPAERQALAAELRGHVLVASRCPHANHVLQKMVTSMDPEDLQFIVDELVGGALNQVARHKYGCRIIQRLVERCHPAQVGGLIDILLREIDANSKHAYGNFVIQNILEHGSKAHRQRIAEIVTGDLRSFGSEPHACAVVAACLHFCAKEDQLCLARALVGEPGLMALMAYTRHGHVATLRLLKVLEAWQAPELTLAVQVLEAEVSALRASRYGRVLVEHLEASGEGPEEEEVVPLTAVKEP